MRELEHVVVQNRDLKDQDYSSGNREADSGRIVYLEDEVSIEDALGDVDFRTCMTCLLAKK